MAESTVVYTPENNGGSIPAWMAMNNGGLLGNNGWGAGIVGFLLGAWLGNGNGFGFGGGSNAGADTQRELINTAVMSQGEASRAAVQNLATMIGQDFNLVNGGVQTIQSALSSLAISQAVSVPQIINSIQSGNSSLMGKLCECCCENRLLTTQQGYEARIQTIEQTNQLGAQADRNTASVVGAINDLKATTISEFCAARERDMQAKIDTQADIITQLRGQISNDAQTAAFTAAFNTLNQKLTDLSARQPNTVPVQWPALTAVNTTPYVNGGFYGSSFGYGNGINF